MPVQLPLAARGYRLGAMFGGPTPAASFPRALTGLYRWPHS
jgi:hypothetical protein